MSSVIFLPLKPARTKGGLFIRGYILHDHETSTTTYYYLVEEPIPVFVYAYLGDVIRYERTPLMGCAGG